MPPVMEARTNHQWLSDLAAEGEQQAAAIGDLRALLLRASHHAFSRSSGALAHVSADEIDQMAEDCA